MRWLVYREPHSYMEGMELFGADDGRMLLELVDRSLCLDASRRLTPAQALRHPIFRKYGLSSPSSSDDGDNQNLANRQPGAEDTGSRTSNEQAGVRWGRDREGDGGKDAAKDKKKKSEEPETDEAAEPEEHDVCPRGECAEVTTLMEEWIAHGAELLQWHPNTALIATDMLRRFVRYAWFWHVLASEQTRFDNWLRDALLIGDAEGADASRSSTHFCASVLLHMGSAILILAGKLNEGDVYSSGRGRDGCLHACARALVGDQQWMFESIKRCEILVCHHRNLMLTSPALLNRLARDDWE